MKRQYFFVGGLLTAMITMVLAGALVMSGCASAPANSAASEASASDTTGDAAASLPITVVSREDGSGTRSAFVELFGVETETADGKKVDATTSAAIITNSTSVMLTSVSGDPAAIGYLSLGSLNSTVTAVDINGVAATTENVKSGSYPIQRPFNIAIRDDLSDAGQDFINFIMSSSGQKVIEENHYIAVNANAPAYTSNNAEGKVVVAGSSSVSPVMEKLQEAYAAANPGVSVEIQTSDSSTGMSSAIEGICDIGMASRALKDSELEKGLVSTEIALDGIAVIVNNDNANNAFSTEQVRDIFLGTITNWKDISA